MLVGRAGDWNEAVSCELHVPFTHMASMTMISVGGILWERVQLGQVRMQSGSVPCHLLSDPGKLLSSSSPGHRVDTRAALVRAVGPLGALRQCTARRLALGGTLRTCGFGCRAV